MWSTVEYDSFCLVTHTPGEMSVCEGPLFISTMGGGEGVGIIGGGA